MRMANRGKLYRTRQLDVGKGEKGIKDDSGSLSLSVWRHSLEQKSGGWIGLTRMER